MATTPRVTVIIPTYNYSAVLPYAIQSVQNQTVRDWVLWVAGDGCTDDSAEVVRSFRKKDSRVHWLNLPENVGQQGGPINAALKRANSDWIAYLGHDDLWLPRHLERLLARAEEAKADAVYGLCRLIPPNNGMAFTPLKSPEYVPGRWYPPTSFMHSRAIIEKAGRWRLPHALEMDPEVDLLNRFARHGATFAFSPRPTAIKFPAAFRKNVYRKQPWKEQAAWWKRIRKEPDLDCTLLEDLFLGLYTRKAAKRTKASTPPTPPDPKSEKSVSSFEVLNQRRRFKGLDPLPDHPKPSSQESP